jgi:hypothetical protein
VLKQYRVSTQRWIENADMEGSLLQQHHGWQ